MNNTLITIVIPVYNTEKYIKNCLDSIVNQTYENLLILVVDDGSKDSSCEIVNSYITNDSRIKLLKSNHGGASHARNVGIDYFMNHKESDLITFVDSDDLIEKDYIENLYNTMNKYDSDVSTCDYKFINDNNIKDELCTQLYNKEETLNLYFQDLVYTESPVHKLFKKYIFNELRFEEGKYFEDTYISYKIIEKCNKVSHIDYKGYIIRPREGSSTRSGYSNNEYDKVKACLEIYLHYKNTKFEIRAYNKYLGSLLYFIIKTNYNDKVTYNKKAIDEVCSLIKTNGFRNAKFKFYPFIVLTKLNLIKYVKI